MPPKGTGGSRKKGAPTKSKVDPPPKRARKKTARAAQEGAASLGDSENGSGNENQKDGVDEIIIISFIIRDKIRYIFYMNRTRIE